MTPNQLMKHFQTERKAAEALGKTQACINRWNQAGKIPQWSQLAIQTITQGKLKADKK